MTYGQLLAAIVFIIFLLVLGFALMDMRSGRKIDVAPAANSQPAAPNPFDDAYTKPIE